MTSVLFKSLLTVCLVMFGALAARAAEPQPAAILTVTKMCCAKESVPAIKQLNRVPGIARVVANHKARTLTIIAKQDEIPSPRAIWEAAEKTNINPVRLATTEGVYQKKPVR